MNQDGTSHSSAVGASMSATAKARCEHDDALAVLERLRASGHVAYFAGGCVRDLLLGREPKDWDVATDAPPNRVRSLFPNTQAVGAAFGVILVRFRRSVIEVATFRADSEYVDGRHPVEVRFTTAEEDARRRDFTINGLFLDPLREGTIQDQVIDYVGGRDDLAAARIRAIGDPNARFNEDHLRVLRAVRFAARFGFEIEQATAEAIRGHAQQLVRISPERIADELRIMLTPPTRGAAYRALEQLALRGLFFRFLELPSSTVPGDQTDSVFAELARQETISFGLSLAAASVDQYRWNGPANEDVRQLFEKPAAQKIVRALRQSLKISNDESEEIEGTLAGLGALFGTELPPVAIMKRFLAQPTSRASRALLEAADKLRLLNGDRVQFLRAKLAELEKTDFAPPPFITGNDLTGAGMTPGPVFKRVLDAVYDAQLEGRITSINSAMEMALEIVRG